jgi:diguanylate cyclase (GGDEF)-like protein/PAS domain S-box-containing protein
VSELFDRVDMGLLWLDESGLIGLCNRWLSEAARWPAPPLGQTLEQAFGPELSPKLVQAVDEALRRGRSVRLSHAFHPTPLPLAPRRGDAQQRLQQQIDVQPAEHGGRMGCLIQVRDLTELTRREALLKEQARRLAHDLGELRIAQDELTRQSTRLRELTRIAPVALFETDLQGMLLYTNERFLSLWQLRIGGILGRHWSALLPAAAAAAMVEPWKELLAAQDRPYRDVRVAQEGETERWLRMEASLLRNLDGEAFGTLSSLVDVSELYRRSQQFEHRAHHDALTGLPNRDRLLQRLEGALAAARHLGRSLPLVFLDLDGFKPINDRHGHATGDALLQALAQRLRRQLRADDLLARVGGDEFALLLSDADGAAQVARIMAKLEDVLREPFELNGLRLHVGCSWGLAQYPADGGDADALLAAADARMYLHKQQRRRRDASTENHAP